MPKIFNRALQIGGEARKVGTPYITVLEYDSSGMVTKAKGATVPSNGDAGYAVGCVFVDTDSGTGATFYVNEGSTTSAAFNVSAGGATGDITSVVAGAGLTGGGTSGAVTLNVINTDGKITVGADTIDITAGSLVNADIGTSAAVAWSKMAALTSAHLLVGNGSNVAVDVAVTGDIAIDNAGLTSIASGVIINADVNTSAAIVESKLAFSTSTGHNHDGANSKLVSVGTATNIAQAASIEAGANDVNLATTTQTVGATTLTIPDFASVVDTFVFATLAQTLVNKSLTDATTYFKDNADATKVMQFQLSSITTGTTRTLTVPDATGTLTVLGNTSTGSGSVVLASTPTLVTPVLGVATATSINKVALTAPATASTLTIADGKTLTVSRTIQFTSAGDSGVITVPNATATLTSTSDNLSVFAATTSAQLAGVISNETGSGLLVFGTGPTLNTPIINGRRLAVVSKSGAYTAVATDEIILNDATAAAYEIALPTAASIAGTVYTIVKIDAGANAVTINPAGAETINGSATVALSTQWAYRTVVSDGTNWVIISS